MRGSTWPSLLRSFALSLLLVAAALALRLLVWHWREPYPLGGDEQEYLNAALTLLRERQYVELQFMRPPLYTIFLAGSAYLFDSAVQNLRLVQAVVSALTVLPVAWLAKALFGSRRVAFVAALLFALNYTLAATATELLAETLFLFGLSVALWLVVRAGQAEHGQWQSRTLEASNPVAAGRAITKLHPATPFAILAGLALGALALTRSVALPLAGLATLWLLLRSGAWSMEHRAWRSRLMGGFVLLPLAFCLVVLPWTLRNYTTYGALILIDTTGAENLWLDNNVSAATPADPLGREAAKRELYALGNDRAARQQLASQRGIAEIRANPAWLVQKAWGEAKRFFALQFFDELREKRAIWVPPAEVAAKLMLGDGLWLVLLFGGLIGLCAAPLPVGLRLLLALWCLYILATSMLFHVELRYRLPVYPALAPFAAFTLIKIVDTRLPRAWPRLRHAALAALCAVVCCAIAVVMLMHRPYGDESWMLLHKHAALWNAERALEQGQASTAQAAATNALAHDDTSALAQVALARAALLRGDQASAHAALDGAIQALQAHPQAHLLRGALLRQRGAPDQARSELAYETASLQDLQHWSWQAFTPVGAPPAELQIGGGLDLGFVRGFHPAEQAGFRWSRTESSAQLTAPAAAQILEIEAAPGRPSGAPPATVVLFIDGAEQGRFLLREGWHTYRLPLAVAGPLEITLRTTAFRPRDYNRASPDNRELGIMVRRIAARP